MEHKTEKNMLMFKGESAPTLQPPLAFSATPSNGRSGAAPVTPGLLIVFPAKAGTSFDAR